MPALAQLKNLAPRQRILLGASVLGILVVAYFMLSLATRPSLQAVVSGLEPAKTGEVTAALDEAAITYELANGGTTVNVVDADVARARIALATAGVKTGGGSQPGYDLLNEQKLGASESQQKIAFQRALEGEIANTIGQVQGVGDATVRLVMPEDELFSDEQTPATAAVLLAGGTELEPSAVKGIAQIVTNSVQGLKSEQVTITDGAGQILWPQGEGAGEAGTGVTSKLAAETKFERQAQAQLMAMLAQSLGPDHAQVTVNADLNIDEATTDKLSYDRTAVVTEEQVETEELEGGGVPNGGAAGAGGNIPSYAQGAGAVGVESNYERETNNRKFARGKTVTRTKVAPGRLNRQGVSVTVDSEVFAKLSPAQQRDLEEAIKSAAGIDEQRGDSFKLAAMPFAKQAAPPAAPAGPIPPTMVGYAKYGALGLATLLFLFFVRRHLRRREKESLGDAPAWLLDLQEPIPLKELEAAEDFIRPRLPMLPPRQVDPGVHKLTQLMDREPDRIASQLKQWMSED